MNQLQVKETQRNQARAALKTYLASLKNEDGSYKAMTADHQAELKRHEDGILALDAEVKAVEKLVNLEADNEAALKAAPGSTFPKPGDEDEEGRTGTKSVRVFAQPRTGRVKSFKAYNGVSAEERAYRFAHWFLANVLGNGKSAKYCRDHGLAVRAMSENVNTAGGALVPDEFSNDMIDLQEEYGDFRKWADKEPMTREVKMIPRRTGGLTGYWIVEGATITDSQFATDDVQLTAKTLAALGIFSKELMMDASVDMGEKLFREIGITFATMEDEAGFNGDGTSTYGRVVGVREKIKGLSGTIANIAGLVVGAGNAYSELTLANHVAVVGRLPQYARKRNNARWFVHHEYYYSVMYTLALAAGGVSAAEVLRGDTTGQPTFLHYPVEFIVAMPRAEANSQVCALFGDMELAASLGDRQEKELALSTEYKFAQNQLAVRGTERLDINVHDVGNASGTAGLRVPGPIVGLITAAA